MYRLAICCITTLPIFQINNWGSYWNRTNLMGFADPHLTARPKNHFGWKTRLELATSWTTIRRSNQLNYNHHIVARIGIEPMTFGLWLQRSNQLSYLAINVGMEGLEPSTNRVSGEYSNQLSYIPNCSPCWIRTNDLRVNSSLLYRWAKGEYCTPKRIRTSISRFVAECSNPLNYKCIGGSWWTRTTPN